MGRVRPLLIDRAQKKFLLATIDYFTKWVEADSLVMIMAQQVQKFIWILICHFGLSQTAIIDNGRQFAYKRMVEFYKSLGIKQVTSSVEHPQMNGQAKVVNKTIFIELKKMFGGEE